MLGAARRAHVCRTVHRRGGRGRRGSGGRAGYGNDGTGRGQRNRQRYKLHCSSFSRGLETSCGGVCGGPKPAELQATHRRLQYTTGDVALRRRWRTGAGDIEGARSRSHGPAAERPELRLGEPESTHCWIDNLPDRVTRLLRLE